MFSKKTMSRNESFSRLIIELAAAQPKSFISGRANVFASLCRREKDKRQEYARPSFSFFYFGNGKGCYRNYEAVCLRNIISLCTLPMFRKRLLFQ